MAESSYVYLINPAFQFINVSGKPLTDGYINLYISGTRSKYYAFSDFDGTLHPFNIPLNSLGSAVVLVSPAHSYDVYVYNSLGTLQMSRFNVIPATGEGTVIKDVVNIKSEDNSVRVKESTDFHTDTKNFDLSVNTDIIATKESVEYLESSLLSKQDVLTPGSNIAITNNIISATGIPTKTSELVNDSGFVSNTHKNKWYDIASYLGSMSNNITAGLIHFYYNPFLLLIRFDLWLDCNSTSSINAFNFVDDIPSNFMLGIRDTIGRTNKDLACIARVQPSTGAFAKHVNVSANSNFIKADTFNSIGCPNEMIYDYLASKGFIED